MSTSKTHSIHNPSSKNRKLSPLNSGGSSSSGTTLHAGSKVNKVKGGKPQDVYDDGRAARRQQPSWSHQQRQQQRHQSGPSTDNWSGNYHQRFGTQDPGRSVSSKDLSSGGRQLQTQVVGERDGGGGGKEEGEGEGEEELSEMFSQLYQSSQASELDKVYFDMKDVMSEDIGGNSELSGRTSILMEQEAGSRETQESSSHGDSMETVCSSNNEQLMSTSHERHQLLSQTSTASSSSSVFSSQQRYLSLSSHPHAIPLVHHPRLILCGAEGMGQSSLLSPALLHALEEFPVKTLDLTTVFATSTKTPEEACTQVGTLGTLLLPCFCLKYGLLTVGQFGVCKQNIY